MNNNIKKSTLVVLIIILMIQVLGAIYFGGQKEGYHIDEIYTCTLANYKDGFVSWTEGTKNEWTSGAFYKEVIKVTDEERFNYTMVYENQEKDVHPPLYYYLIHSLSSASGSFSKYIGIILNIFFGVLTSTVLFGVSKKVLADDKMALLCTFVWALSVGAMESMVFIRMYMMLTFFCLLLTSLHLKSFEDVKSTDNISVVTLMELFGCTVLGILTQYYYMIFCFFLCGFFFVHLLLQKKWKSLIKYCFAEISALISSVIYFPAMLKHIFDGYRGEQAFNEFAIWNDFFSKLKMVLGIIYVELFNGLIGGIILVLSISGCLYCLKKIQWSKNICAKNYQINKKNLSSEFYCWVWLEIVCMGYIIVVTQIAPFQTDRYFMCIYPLLVIVIIGIVKVILQLVLGRKGQIVTIVMFLAIILGSHSSQELYYLFKESKTRRNELANYQGTDAVVLNGEYDSSTDWWIMEFGEYNNVFVCGQNGDMTGLIRATATKDLSKGFLLYAHGMNETDEELFKRIGEYINIKSYELITDINCRVFFCVLK